MCYKHSNINGYKSYQTVVAQKDNRSEEHGFFRQIDKWDIFCKYIQDSQIPGGDPLTENGKRLYLAPKITAKPKRVYKTKRWNEMYKQIKVTTKDGK